MQRKKSRMCIYDIETYRQLFVVCFIDIKSGERFSFEISRRVNQIEELIDFLKTTSLLIGFNNVGFDYPIIHKLILNKNTSPAYYYNLATNIIDKDERSYFNSFLIPQIDLYKILHLDNPAKRAGLKQIEFFIGHDNLQELPYRPEESLSYKQMDEITSYCFNDCDATLKLYNLCKEKIELRYLLSNTYKLDLYNLSDSSIGEAIFTKYILEKKGIELAELKSAVLKPKDFNFSLGDVILPYIQFESEEFNSVIDFFKNSTVTNGQLKNVFNYSVTYKGLQFDYGAGGLHGTIKGIWEEDEEWLIVDADAGQFYPSIAIQNKIYPKHIGLDYVITLSDLTDIRNNAKKDLKVNPKNQIAKALNAGIKLSANSLYGKGNNVYSLVYSPEYVAATTVNGQLLLTLLAEKLSNIPSVQVFYLNTDGLTYKVKKVHYEETLKICQEWEALTKIQLEFNLYKKMFLRDVNNFIAVDEKGKIKYKGAYEINKEVAGEPAVWKNNSSKIIPIAVSEYFINGVPIEDTIMKHQNILDFCILGKANRGWSIYQGDKRLPNVNRYYISSTNDLGTIVKVNNTDGRIISLEAHPRAKYGESYNLRVINNINNQWNGQFDINYEYYINAARKLVSSIEK